MFSRATIAAALCAFIFSAAVTQAVIIPVSQKMYGHAKTDAGTDILDTTIVPAYGTSAYKAYSEYSDNSQYERAGATITTDIQTNKIGLAINTYQEPWPLVDLSYGSTKLTFDVSTKTEFRFEWSTSLFLGTGSITYNFSTSAFGELPYFPEDFFYLIIPIDRNQYGPRSGAENVLLYPGRYWIAINQSDGYSSGHADGGITSVSLQALPEPAALSLLPLLSLTLFRRRH